MRTSLILALLATALSGCLGRQEALPPGATYDFSPVPWNAQGALPRLEVVLPAWLNSQNVQYRFLHRDPNQLNEYAYARWAGAPSALMQQRLRIRLAGALATENCRLQINVQEFVQTFTADDASRADLQAEVRAFDTQNRLLATRPLAIQQPATSADARGGVAALAGVVDQAAKDIGSWVAQEKRLAVCLPK